MKAFTNFLAEYRGGALHQELTKKMNDAVLAVNDTQKTAEITMKIKIVPEKTGGSQRTISAVVSAKLPEPPIPDAVFFSDDEGNLHKSDPAQEEMRFQAVENRRDQA